MSKRILLSLFFVCFFGVCCYAQDATNATVVSNQITKMETSKEKTSALKKQDKTKKHKKPVIKKVQQKDVK